MANHNTDSTLSSFVSTHGESLALHDWPLSAGGTARGVVLLLALIMLVAMTLAGIVMYRQIGTGLRVGDGIGPARVLGEVGGTDAQSRVIGTVRAQQRAQSGFALQAASVRYGLGLGSGGSDAGQQEQGAGGLSDCAGVRS